MWFDGFSDLVRIVLVGTAAYVTVVVVLRLSGKRTLAKLNAFDLVVTVALGSTLATIVLNSDVSWSEGATALALLAILQLAVALTSRWIPGGRAVMTARPTVLLVHGCPLEDTLRDQRVTVDELRQAVRATGRGDLSSVAVVVLESDGTFSVIASDALGDGSALTHVENAPCEPGTPGPGCCDQEPAR